MALDLNSGDGGALFPAGAKRAARQPLDADVVAAWFGKAITGTYGVGEFSYDDYSPNNPSLHISGVQNCAPSPDLVKGDARHLAWQGGPSGEAPFVGFGGAYGGVDYSALSFAGDRTFTCRLQLTGGQGMQPWYQYIYGVGNYNGSPNTQQNWSVGILANSYAFFSYWKAGTGTGDTDVLVQCSSGFGNSARLQSADVFFSARLSTATRTVTYGLQFDGADHGVYEVSNAYGAGLDPVVQPGGVPYIGRVSSAGPIGDSMGLLGSIGNPVMRNRFLTDNEVERLARIAMGY